jgi:tRNA dimethylallyltransferase
MGTGYHQVGEFSCRLVVVTCVIAKRQIDEMHENNELPIIVGGTSYWIQHLIFPDRLVSKDIARTPSPGLEEEKHLSPELAKSSASLPAELLEIFKDLPLNPPSAKTNPDLAFKLHRLLSVLDPPISQRWHWKDTRKVLRSLEIIQNTGKRPSHIIYEQSLSAESHKPR